MSPRPDTTEVLDLLEDATGLDWSITTDEPDKLSFAMSHFRLDIVWEGDYWTFKLYDFTSTAGEDEPRWAQGPMHNATEVKNELSGFLPKEVERR